MRSVKSGNDSIRQNALFLNVKITIENFEILKPPAGLQKVPSYMLWNLQNTLLIS
jgi:hypothetical protein